MRFNKRQRDALKYFAEHQDMDYHTPYGIGESTMSDLVKHGYVTRIRNWIGYTYKITEKGLNTVGNWIPDDVQMRLDKWNKAVGNK